MLGAACHSQEWLTDFDAAKRKATAEKKQILLVFTGSDWCPRCQELEEKLWQTAEFKAEAKEKWVLLKADFPQKGGMPEPVDVNAMNMILTERYNRNGFFPYIVLLDKYGRVLGRTGYEEFDTAKEYLFLLRNMKP